MHRHDISSDTFSFWFFTPALKGEEEVTAEELNEQGFPPGGLAV
jgi:hypothetical protein